MVSNSIYLGAAGDRVCVRRGQQTIVRRATNDPRVMGLRTMIYFAVVHWPHLLLKFHSNVRAENYLFAGRRWNGGREFSKSEAIFTFLS